MSWGGGSVGSSPFLHQTCLQPLTLAEGTGGGTDTIPPLQPAPTPKKEAAASPGVCGGRRGPVALPRFFCGPSSSSSPQVRCPFAGGAGWGWEPWQKALANGGMAERRSKKKCAGEMNQLLRASLPELIPILLFPRRKAFGREKWEEGFPSTPSRNQPPLGTVLLRYASSTSPRT